MDHAFVVISRTQKPYVPKLFTMFSSKSFIVLHFTFKSIIHFELIFFPAEAFIFIYFFNIFIGV